MWRYRWSALIIAWLVALLGWPLVFSLPDQFSARTVVICDSHHWIDGGCLLPSASPRFVGLVAITGQLTVLRIKVGRSCASIERHAEH